MPRFRLSLLTLLALLASPAAAEAAAPAPGFQVDLAGPGRAHVECFVVRDVLSCLNYSRAVAPGRCDFGGDVPTVKLNRRERARATFTCVDEGFHGWKRLRPGQTFRSGVFRCRTRDGRSSLRCTSLLSSRSFTIASDGRVRR